ncbi:MAG: hypothetical protein K9W44_00750 [Candidatus Lokiarchaeota archaeon]|nr:hypothetical protein [Candidatus Harpocratesius repetitus]
MSETAETSELSITVGLLGSNHQITKLVGESLGSPGQKSDLQFYNRLDTSLHCVFTAVAPIGYPDKLKSLIQNCAETDIHVMCVDCETGITPEIGEIMVVMDLFVQYYNTKPIAIIGGITKKNEWQKENIHKQLSKFTEQTHLKGMKIISLEQRSDYQQLKEILMEMGQEIADARKSKFSDDSTPESVKVLIDHVFPVKGVGTVVLGLVKQGIVRAGEMYDLAPVQNKVILRSIQKFDRDFKVAYIGDRVGLALKGIKAPVLDRNTVFCSLNSMEKTDEVEGTLHVSPFFKPQHPSGCVTPEDTRNYHLIVDLAISPIKLLGGDNIAPGKAGKLHLKLDKPLVHDKQGLRGIVAEFGPFQNRLRIVGYFHQR